VIRSGTSIGANIAEAYGAVSKKDFINKFAIARKEAKETVYWLKLIERTNLLNNRSNVAPLNELLKEAEELTKILSSIMLSSKGRS
jgi:four helix bundle protein